MAFFDKSSVYPDQFYTALRRKTVDFFFSSVPILSRRIARIRDLTAPAGSGEVG